MTYGSQTIDRIEAVCKKENATYKRTESCIQVWDELRKAFYPCYTVLEAKICLGLPLVF